MSILYLKLWIC